MFFWELAVWATAGFSPHSPVRALGQRSALDALRPGGGSHRARASDTARAQAHFLSQLFQTRSPQVRAIVRFPLSGPVVARQLVGHSAFSVKHMPTADVLSLPTSSLFPAPDTWYSERAQYLVVLQMSELMCFPSWFLLNL